VLANFSFQAIGQVTFNGLVGWFEIDFNQNGEMDKTLIFSTSPNNEPTHWKQALFFFDDVLQLKQDDEIKGELRISRSLQSRRGIKIQICLNIADIHKLSKEFVFN